MRKSGGGQAEYQAARADRLEHPVPSRAVRSVNRLPTQTWVTVRRSPRKFNAGRAKARRRQQWIGNRPGVRFVRSASAMPNSGSPSAGTADSSGGSGLVDLSMPRATLTGARIASRRSLYTVVTRMDGMAISQCVVCTYTGVMPPWRRSAGLVRARGVSEAQEITSTRERSSQGSRPRRARGAGGADRPLETTSAHIVDGAPSKRAVKETR